MIYSNNDGYKKIGGYVINIEPNELKFKKMFESLYQKKFINNQVMFLALDFVLIDFIHSLRFIHVSLIFHIEDSGNVKYKINVHSLNQNSFHITEINFFLIISTMATIITTFLSSFICLKDIFKKNEAYKRFN